MIVSSGITELKITAGHWPFSVQFSTVATENLILFVSNCTDGQSKFHFGQPNPKPYFYLWDYFHRSFACVCIGVILQRFSCTVAHNCTTPLQVHCS